MSASVKGIQGYLSEQLSANGQLSDVDHAFVTGNLTGLSDQDALRVANTSISLRYMSPNQTFESHR